MWRLYAWHSVGDGFELVRGLCRLQRKHCFAGNPQGRSESGIVLLVREARATHAQRVHKPHFGVDQLAHALLCRSTWIAVAGIAVPVPDDLAPRVRRATVVAQTTKCRRRIVHSTGRRRVPERETNCNCVRNTVIHVKIVDACAGAFTLRLETRPLPGSRVVLAVQTFGHTRQTSAVKPDAPINVATVLASGACV